VHGGAGISGVAHQKEHLVRFENSFEVPLPPDEAWDLLLDIERIAPCMPGAELTEIVDDKTFKGNVSVRLGPVALTFSGTATFDTIDNTARKARVKAEGRDPKGRGGANAVVDFELEAAENGAAVLIETDLSLSGSIAQYGRGVGMIRSLAGQLIGQFAEALKAQLATETPEAADAPESNETAGVPQAKPISGFSLMLLAFRDWLKRLFGSG